MQDFNFQLFGILRVSTVRFDGSPSWYLTFYSNLSGRGVMLDRDETGTRKGCDRDRKGLLEF